MTELIVHGAEKVCQRLKTSTDPCDSRKAHDIEELLARAQGPWSGRVKLAGVAAGVQNTLCLPLSLELAGLAYDGQQPQINRLWQGLLFVPPSYPHNMPAFRFCDPIPLSSHVIHPGFLPDETDLPHGMLNFIRALRAAEGGWTCYLGPGDWSAKLSYNFSLAIWLVSRLIVGARFRGEEGAGTLNRYAFNHFQKLAQENKLPLGEPLSFPGDGASADLSIEEIGGDNDVEWIDQQSGAVTQ